MKNDLVFRCYTYDDNGMHNGYIIVESLEALAQFIVSNENDKVITDIGDELIIKTIGSFLDIVPDKEFRNEFLPYLLKAQGYEDIDEEEFPYCVSILDKDNNPSDNLDNFALKEDAIDFAKHNPGSAVFKETCNMEKNTCDYELLWHPCGDCSEYADCQKDMKKCSYSEGFALSIEDKARSLIKILIDNDIDDSFVIAETIWGLFMSEQFPENIEYEEEGGKL